LSLLHSLWIGVSVASVLSLAFQFRPRVSHQTRYLTTLLALFLVAAAPLVTTPVHYALECHAAGNADRREVIAVVLRPSQPREIGLTTNGKPIRSVTIQRSRDSRFPAILSLAISQMAANMSRLQPFVVSTWFVCAVAIMCFLVMGSRAVHRLCREARPAPDSILRAAARLIRRAGLKKPPRVMVHPYLREPCLGGLFPPVILLPEAWLDCRKRELIDAILAHELAHARRWDHLLNPVQRLVEGLFF
jgi:Zn-dependent protease with chaperone function